MITFLKRNQINDTLYNICIENASNSELYAFSWYLDIVSPNWSVLILNNYEAVMPIPLKKKFGISYTYQPLWSLHLGVFGKKNADDFIQELMSHFNYIELRLNPYNTLKKSKSHKINNKQYLEINSNFSTDIFRKDRKKDLIKAEKHKLKFIKSTDAAQLISLFKNNVGKRTPNILEKDYAVLYKLTSTLIHKNFANIFEVYDNENLVAAAFVLVYKKTATILFSSTDFKKRHHGANTFLIAKIIDNYKNEIDKFDFGGSSIPTIASYFKSFGAKTISYPFLKINKLPFLVKIFKS